MPSPLPFLSTKIFDRAARLQALPDLALCAYACTYVNKCTIVSIWHIAYRRLTVPNREWPGLLEWLHQLSAAASEHHRQAALQIFSCLTEVIGNA